MDVMESQRSDNAVTAFDGTGDEPPPAEPRATAPVRAFKRARAGLIVLTAFLVELVLIAAGANQALTKHVERYAQQHPSSFLGHAAKASLIYTWRFTAPKGDNVGGVHVWWSELVTIGAVFVITALLTVVLVRGAVTFLRALLGVWLVVIVATCLARIAAAAVTRSPAPVSGSRFTNAVFSGPTPDTFAAGVGLGLVTALIAAVVAVSTRRTVQVEVPAAVLAAETPFLPPEAPPSFFGDEQARSAAYRARTADASTTAYPTVDPSTSTQSTSGDSTSARSAAPRRMGIADSGTPDSATTAFPAFSSRQAATPRTAETGQDTTSTREFPVPPDDEDLGHHPD